MTFLPPQLPNMAIEPPCPFAAMKRKRVDQWYLAKKATEAKEFAKAFAHRVEYERLTKILTAAGEV